MIMIITECRNCQRTALSSFQRNSGPRNIKVLVLLSFQQPMLLCSYCVFETCTYSQTIVMVCLKHVVVCLFQVNQLKRRLLK